MINPAYTLISKVVRIRKRLLQENKSQRPAYEMRRHLAEFNKYADYWKNNPTALKKWLARHEAEFNRLIPPTKAGDGLKNQFTKIVLA